MTQTYKVQGMSCGGCASSVTRAIQHVAPSAQVEVDLETGAVTVDGVDDEDAVRRAVEDAGFEFGGPI